MSSEIEGYIAHHMWECRGETILPSPKCFISCLIAPVIMEQESYLEADTESKLYLDVFTKFLLVSTSDNLWKLYKC